jgi:hypothetical protein
MEKFESECKETVATAAEYPCENRGQLDKETLSGQTVFDEEASRRRQEMESWQQDWERMGSWLLCSRIQCDSLASDREEEEEETCTGGGHGHPDQQTSLNMLPMELSVKSDWKPVCSEVIRLSSHGLEKKRSLRNRMQRGVSDGYVFALKTVAAVRRVGRE